MDAHKSHLLGDSSFGAPRTNVKMDLRVSPILRSLFDCCDI